MTTRAALLALCLLACGGGERSSGPAIGNAQTAPAAPLTSAKLVGVWERPVGAGEMQRMRLFPSGVFAFQHVGNHLPIARSVGTWSFREGWLGLKIEGTEPDSAVFPFAWLLEATLAGDRLRLHADTLADEKTTTWTRVAEPYGNGPGVEQRAASDERDWTELLKRAESKPRF